MKRTLRVLTCVAVVVGAVGHSTVASGVEGFHEKLYVLLPGVDKMAVVDVLTDKVLKMVTVGKGAHGLASPKDHRVLWVAVEDTGWLMKVDTVKDEVIGRFPIGRRPNEPEITPDGRFLYVPVLGEGKWKVFDTVENRIAAEIAVNGFPHNTAVSEDGQRMYLAPYDMQMRSMADMIAQNLPLTMNNLVYIADTRTHRVIRRIDVGGVPRPMALSKDERRLYVNVDGLLGFHVIDVPSGKLLHRVEYPLTPHERAVPSRSHGVWLTLDQRTLFSNDVAHSATFVFDVSVEPPTFLTRIPQPGGPYWNAMTMDGKTLYVANTGAAVVSVIDVATRSERGRIQFEDRSSPHRVQVLNVPTS